jgi:hypothetical protein
MTPSDKIDLYYIIRNIKWRYKLDKFEDQALREIMKSVGQARYEIMSELDNRFGKRPRPWTDARNKELLDELNKLTAGIKDQLGEDVSEVARIAYEQSLDEHNLIMSIGGRAANVSMVLLVARIAYEQSLDEHNLIMSIGGRAANVSMVSLAEEQIQNFLTTPIGGMYLNDWVQRTFDYPLQDRLKEELGAGLFRGESYPKLAKRINQLLSDAANNVDTLVRSWVQAANVNAQHTVAQQNEDVIKGWRWDATLENGNFSRGHGTCLRCLALDARDEVYQMNGGPPLPLHPNCRCVRRYVTKSYRELGISLDDLNDAVRPYTTRGNIDPVTGTVKRGKTGTGGLPLLSAGRIDGGMDEFFKSLPEQLQKQTLGTRRYELWKDGQIKLYDLADENGDLKLVKEL